MTLSLIQLLTADHSSYFMLVISFSGRWEWDFCSDIYSGGSPALPSINQLGFERTLSDLRSCFALLTYSLTDVIGASGLLAVYIAALVIGNQDLTYRHSISGLMKALPG
ncbi:hypothetical protein PO124_15005 [Bacillus licheniformis]|nr:hypothetical protein [Bacillus licheniformis]